MPRMRRTTMLAFVVLGAALAALAFSTTSGKLSDAAPAPPSAAAGPQAAQLDWREVHGSGEERIVFEVETLEVDTKGWSARVAVTNDTSIPYELGDPAATLDRAFGLMLFATGDASELQRRNRNGTLPTTRPATGYEPSLPRLLTPHGTWRGTISAPGTLVARSWVRVVFGALVAVGSPPDGLDDRLVWITDHAYELQP
jgi:hypothetical protein